MSDAGPANGLIIMTERQEPRTPPLGADATTPWGEAQSLITPSDDGVITHLTTICSRHSPTRAMQESLAMSHAHAGLSEGVQPFKQARFVPVAHWASTLLSGWQDGGGPQALGTSGPFGIALMSRAVLDRDLRALCAMPNARHAIGVTMRNVEWLSSPGQFGAFFNVDKGDFTMKGLVRFAGPIGLSAALVLSAASTSQAQATKKVRSDVRIGVQKDRSVGTRTTTPRDSVTVTSTGDVELINATRARIDSVAADAARERARVDAMVSDFEARNAALGRSMTAVQDSLMRVRGEVTAANNRTMALSDSLRFLRTRFYNFKNGSLFNNSGFYIGLGSGANFTSGTLENSGYHQGLNVMVPIGWQKHGNLIGIRTEFGVQTFDGQSTAAGPFVNHDPKVFTGIGMLTLHIPVNQAKTNTFFLMGGGGIYSFRDYGPQSALADRLGSSTSSTSTSKTKAGITGGAGLELHILGATSFFVESRLTSVMADNSASGIGGSKNLMWVPVTLGFTLR